MKLKKNIFRTAAVLLTVIAGFFLFFNDDSRGIASAAPAAGAFIQASNFKVEIDGVQVSGISKISGLQSESEVIEYKDGEDKVIKHRPGRTKYSNLVITREMSAGENTFRKWRQLVIDGSTERKSGSIVYLDKAGKEISRYTYHEAWPCRYTIFNSDDGKLMEEVELVLDKGWDGSIKGN